MLFIPAEIVPLINLFASSFNSSVWILVQNMLLGTILCTNKRAVTQVLRVIGLSIETPRGYKNASTGIALRGPLSQFFSGIYLKSLDDTFDNMNVTYLRYQDDIIILCKTKRQLNRCRRRIMEVLQERRLHLSRKKTRMGCIKKGFHFLGIHYPATQPQNNIN